jgi:septum formation protein
MTRRLVLASTSRYRRELLDRLGLPYEAASPPFDEDEARRGAPQLSPTEMALAFARGKVESLAATYPDALLLGGDQVPAIEETILTKPGTREAAHAQLRALAGKTHQLLTAVALLDSATGRLETRLDVHEMTMWPLTDDEIATYLDRDEPYDCAGSYRVEAAGPLLFETMRGEDWTGIVGLPLTKVMALLRAHGVTGLVGRG